VRQYLFLTAILLLIPGVFASTASNVFRIEWELKIQNSYLNDARDVEACVLILDNHAGWVNQRILWENIPADEVLHTEENRIAVFRFPLISRGESKVLRFQQLVKVDRTEFDLSRSLGDKIPPELLSLTKPVDHLWENHPLLVTKAAELTENAATPREKLERIFDFVKSYLTYLRQKEEHGALWAYQNRVGDCTEFTNLLIALCRLSGIPAKFVSAIGYSREKEGDFYAMGHAFAVVYLPDLGWIPVDATWSSPAGELGKSSEEKLVLLTSDGSNLIEDSKIKMPKDYISYSYTGEKPDLRFVSRATIYKEVGLEVSIDASSVLERGNSWEWYVKLTNEGRIDLHNLRVKLIADNRYLDTPEEVLVDNLPGGWTKTISFHVKVKQNAENLPVMARVEYESPYGTFFSTAESVATVYLPQPLPGLPQLLQNPPLLFATAMVLILVVATVLLIRRF